MARRHRRSQIPDSVIFPFISVLFCTIGAVVVMWISASLQLLVADKNLPQLIEETREEVLSLREVLARERHILAEKDAAYDKLVKSLQQEQRTLNTVLERKAQLRAQMAALKDQIAALKQDASMRDWHQRMKEIAEEQLKIERLQELRRYEKEHAAVSEMLAKITRQIETLHERERLLAEKITAAQERLAFLQTIDEPMVELEILGLDDRQPVYIEVTAEHFIILDEQRAPITRTDFLKEGGVLDELGRFAQHARVYPILLIRPGAQVNSRQALKRLRQQRIQFAAEPVNAEWSLDGVRGLSRQGWSL